MRKNILILSFLGLICGVSEIKAETWNCGEKDSDGNYGANVKCTLDENGNFTVSGTGKMADYGWSKDTNYTPGRGYNFPASDAPWGNGSRVEMQKIKNIVIENGVTGIGANAFCGADRAKTATVADSVKSIGERGFYDLYALQSIKAKGVETVGNSAFGFNMILNDVYMPNASNLGNYAFYYTDKLEYAEFSDNVSLGGGVFTLSSISGCLDGICANCGNKFVQKGTGCVDKCLPGYSAYYDYCLRTRYTLPEADAATSNDNENMIEWIFE